MGDKIDQTKDRAKDAADDARWKTENEKLKREDQVDRARAAAREKVDEAADKVRERAGRDRP